MDNVRVGSNPTPGKLFWCRKKMCDVVAEWGQSHTSLMSVIVSFITASNQWMDRVTSNTLFKFFSNRLNKRKRSFSYRCGMMILSVPAILGWNRGWKNVYVFKINVRTRDVTRIERWAAKFPLYGQLGLTSCCYLELHLSFPYTCTPLPTSCPTSCPSCQSYARSMSLNIF